MLDLVCEMSGMNHLEGLKHNLKLYNLTDSKRNANSSVFNEAPSVM